MGRISKTLTFSVPPETYEEYEDLARDRRKTKSELFREMVKVYEDYLNEVRWQTIQRLGERTAKNFNIISEDDIDRIIHE